jgi:hypothetical protein
MYIYLFFFTYINYFKAVLIHTLILNFILWVQEQLMIFIRAPKQPLLVEQQPFVCIREEKKCMSQSIKFKIVLYQLLVIHLIQVMDFHRQTIVKVMVFDLLY